MKILDFGLHPFADTFIPEERLDEGEPIYPLRVYMEKNGYIHLITKTFDRYNLYDYSYTSANSSFSRNHWNEFAKMLFAKNFAHKDSYIVEIGSNDGFLLNIIKSYGCKTLGVDASRSICKIANKNGVKTVNFAFNLASSRKIKKMGGKADIIIANNVFNHADKPEDFLAGVVNLLSDDGVFIFEVPDWYYTIKSLKFDQIYHEHRTYFTAKYLYKLLSAHGMEIAEISEVEYHGGSLRGVARKSGAAKRSKELTHLIDREEKAGLFKRETYVKYMDTILKKRKEILAKIYALKKKGYPIVGIGAAAKANTFLNFYNLDYKTIDFVTDSSPFKQGKYTPMSRIPIVSDKILSKYKKVYALVLSWNLDLNAVLLKINPRLKFLKI